MRNLIILFLATWFLSVTFGCYGPCGDDPIFDAYRTFTFTILNDQGESIFDQNYNINDLTIYREYGEYQFVPEVKGTTFTFTEYFGFLTIDTLFKQVYHLNYSSVENDSIIISARTDLAQGKCPYKTLRELIITFNSDTVYSENTVPSKVILELVKG